MRWVLFALAAGAVLVRGLVFSEGGTAGAWASVIVFWICLPAFVAVSLAEAVRNWRAGNRTPMVQVTLVALLIGSFVLNSPETGDTRSTVAVLIFLGSIVGLVVLAIKSWFSSPTSS